MPSPAVRSVLVGAQGSSRGLTGEEMTGHHSMTDVAAVTGHDHREMGARAVVGPARTPDLGQLYCATSHTCCSLVPTGLGGRGCLPPHRRCYRHSVGSNVERRVRRWVCYGFIQLTEQIGQISRDESALICALTMWRGCTYGITAPCWL